MKLKHILLGLAACLCLSCAKGPQPISVIFDTDMGNDVDDAMALDMLFKYQDAGVVDLKAIMVNKGSEYAPQLVDIQKTWYGYPDIPIGRIEDGTMIDDYVDYAMNVSLMQAAGKPMFARTHSDYAKELLPAHILYRKVLAAQPDKSVTIISVGFSTNLARLLETAPDEYSELTGRELMEQKVAKVSVMGGQFLEKPYVEFNIKHDIPAAQKLFAECPAPIYVSPFNLGQSIRYPVESILADFDWGVNHPMVEAYLHYRPMPYSRQTWDLTSVLFAIEPQYFSVSEGGQVRVDSEGHTFFCQEEGLPAQQYVLSATEEQREAILSRFKELLTTKPKSIEGIDNSDTSFSTLMAGSSEDQKQAWYNGSTCIKLADIAGKAEQLRQQKKILCFDLDGTITNHKTPITPEAKAALDSIAKHYDMVMVGAGNAPRVYHQMGDYPIDIVGNYGMQESRVIDGRFTITKELTTPVDSQFFLSGAKYIREKYGYTEYKGESVEFHKTGMVTFAMLGTKADREDKLVYDPDRAKRREMYPEVLKTFPGVIIYIGGSSSFDMAPERFNKYDASLMYAKLHGYNKSEVLFVGDDFGDGGGDSHIRLGGVDYIFVENFEDFPELMSYLYSNK